MTDISTASAAGQVQGQLKNIRQVRLFMCLTSIDTPRSKPFTLVSNVSNYHDSYYYIKIRNLSLWLNRIFYRSLYSLVRCPARHLRKKFIFPSIHVLFSMKRFSVSPYRVKETRVSRTRHRSGKIGRGQNS